jgi:hypothetical protein
MNEELQQAIVKVIESMTGVAQSAYSFSAEQMPEVVEQLLTWELTKSFIGFAFGLILMVAGVLGILYLFSSSRMSKRVEAARVAKQAFDAGEPWTRYVGSNFTTSIKYDTIQRQGQEPIHSDTDIVTMAGCVLASVAGLICAATSLTWLKILIAPKVWLIEYAAGLVK